MSLAMLRWNWHLKVLRLRLDCQEEEVIVLVRENLVLFKPQLLIHQWFNQFHIPQITAPMSCERNQVSLFHFFSETHIYQSLDVHINCQFYPRKGLLTYGCGHIDHKTLKCSIAKISWQYIIWSIFFIWRPTKILELSFFLLWNFSMPYHNQFQVKQLWSWLGMVSHYGMKRTCSQAVLMCHWQRRVWRRQLKLVRESATYLSTWYTHQPWSVHKWLLCLPWPSTVAKR